MFSVSGGARSNVPKVFVLFTADKSDGASMKEAIASAADLRKKGVSLIVVAIGHKDDAYYRIVDSRANVIYVDYDKTPTVIGVLEKRIGTNTGKNYIFFGLEIASPLSIGSFLKTDSFTIDNRQYRIFGLNRSVKSNTL